MGILKKATVEQVAAKIALFGGGGAGKSLTSTLIAIALSKLHHKGAPVVLQDTEGASDWLLPIYEAEGVELHRIKSRTFPDMCQALTEAEQIGACVFTSDSYSHPWAELQESLKKKLNVKKLEFHHMQQLQELWGAWVRQMLNSPLHVILAGRLAYEWENEQDVETGKMGFHKAGTKMRSEKDAGYEPHLLIEMEAIRVLEKVADVKVGGRTKKTRKELKAGGHFLHRLHVLKDRGRLLNGRVFEFKDINDYKPGDFQKVYAELQPHFAQLRLGQGSAKVVEDRRSSGDLFAQDTNAREFGRRRDIALEEIKESLIAIWPGRKDADTRAKQVVLETLFDTLSWSKVETLKVEVLEPAVEVLREMRGRTAQVLDALAAAESNEAAAGAIRTEVTRARDVVAERGQKDLTPDADDVFAN